MPGVLAVKPDSSSASPIAVTAVYLLFIFAGAAVIAPQLYWAAHGLISPGMAGWSLIDHGFHRYVDRCISVLALIGLWPWLRALKLQTARDVGLNTGSPGRDLWAGFLLGAVFILVFGGLLLGLRARTWNPHTAGEWGRHLIKASLAGLLVGFAEEIIFRGGLFQAVRRSRSFIFAAALSSGIYAVVHFFSKSSNPEIVRWYAGLVVLAEMFEGFLHARVFFPAFLNLLLIGFILCVAVERTRAIFFGVGFHAALIFMSKSIQFATGPAAGANSWIWGSNKIIDGWGGGVVLLLLLMIIMKWMKPRHDQASVSPAHETA
jgi:membrane protease YdiL (CAAX protease family)